LGTATTLLVDLSDGDCGTFAGETTASHLFDNENSETIHSYLWRNIGAHQLARTSTNKHSEPGAAPVASIKTSSYKSPSAFGGQCFGPN